MAAICVGTTPGWSVCRWTGATPPGTLTSSPTSSCSGPNSPAPLTPVLQGRSADRPATVHQGNTSVYVGGTVRTDIGVRR
jgi:hypothetical protein